MIFGKKSTSVEPGSLNDPLLINMYGQDVTAKLRDQVYQQAVATGIGPAKIQGGPVEAPNENDMVVRKVRNGYQVIVCNGYGFKDDIYVAKDLDEVAEVLKIGAVNREIDRAK